MFCYKPEPINMYGELLISVQGLVIKSTTIYSVYKEEINLSISSNCMLTVINASAAVTLLEQRPEKNQALSGIRTHDLCDASAVLSQLS